MSSVAASPKVGRQAQLPLKRAFQIAFNSLRIRFWRSMITAGGIFLGIAFFTVVLTQNLMQWPVPEKVDPGFVRIDGQVNGPNDYDVWKPVPVQAGLDAGVPAAVVERAAGGKDTFQLATLVRGRIDAEEADQQVATTRRDWKALGKIKSKFAFFLSVLNGEDVKSKDAIKYGVPARVAKKLANKKGIIAAVDLADALREDSFEIPTFYVAVALDQDIGFRDAAEVGVPDGVAKQLAGDGRTFKALPLNDLMTTMPDTIAGWKKKAADNAIFKTVDKSVVKKLDRAYAVTLDEAIEKARGFAKDARKANVMIVNTDRKVSADFTENAAKAGNTRLQDGDYVLVPDQNSHYRMWWLIIMSLLVCGVGIGNSMLMAVVERFKEIGTMKCLGALDSFVIVLFMLESGMMGVVASVLGWLLGFVSIILIAGFSRGWDIVANIELARVIATLGWAMVVGLVLTILATIFPALQAASMPAANALRSEV